MSANETAREFETPEQFLKRENDAVGGLLDALIERYPGTLPALMRSYAKAYHSSQMSGIAQRAAEKVSAQLQSELNEMGIGYKPNVEFFKEIISQASKVERGEG